MFQIFTKKNTIKYKKVNNYAKKLKITLIFVPANGTGKYQPLDLLIFGIIKQKINQMRRLDPNEHATNKELYHLSFVQTKSAMEALSEESIRQA